jgi:hypothetical protein
MALANAGLPMKNRKSLQVERGGPLAMILLIASACCRRGTIIILTVTVMLSACASAPIDQLNLMPAPDVYGDGLLNPLPESNPFAAAYR